MPLSDTRVALGLTLRQAAGRVQVRKNLLAHRADR